MMKSLLVLAFMSLLQGQSVFFPGPGNKSSTALAPTLDHFGSNTSCTAECAGSPPTTTASLNATAGTVVIVAVWACPDTACSTTAATSDLTSLSDGTNTYVFDKSCQSTQSTAISGWWLYHIQSKTGGTLTLTATFASTKGWYGALMWSSYTNMATSSVFDQSGCAQGGPGVNAGTATTTSTLAQSNELVIGGFFGGHNIVAGSGFTLLNNPNLAGGSNVRDEYVVAGTAGSTTTSSASWPVGSSFTGIVGTYKHQ